MCDEVWIETFVYVSAGIRIFQFELVQEGFWEQVVGSDYIQ